MFGLDQAMALLANYLPPFKVEVETLSEILSIEFVPVIGIPDWGKYCCNRNGATWHIALCKPANNVS